MARIAAALLALTLASCATASSRPSCAMSSADRAWLEAALAKSRGAEREFLLLAALPLPRIVAIDGACTYLFSRGRVDRAEESPHQGKPILPDGQAVPIGPVSFATGNAGGYFAMSLPSVWRAAGVTSELGLERLMDAVLLHELMHSRQTELAGKSLDALTAAGGIADDAVNDNIVQERFGNDPEYAATWSEERDLLFAAADAPADADARKLAARALELMHSRHARWFEGENTAYRGFDDIFLTMEGMGQWLAYRFLLSPEGGSLAPDFALSAVRRGGRQWSQDHGLALLLVVDRLLPGWQQRAFRDPDWRAERLLTAAVER